MSPKNIIWSKTNALFAKSAEKYRYFDGSYSYQDIETSKVAKSISLSKVGWGRRAVEMRANKTRFDAFENDTIGLNDIFEKYKCRQAFERLREDILVCGAGFLALSGDRVLPFTAEEATGVFDWSTQSLSSGLAVFRRKSDGSAASEMPDSFTIYNKDETITVINGNQTSFPNMTGRPLIGLLTHKSTTKQPFGRTVLVNTARQAMVDGSRIMRQAMIAAHHYNTKVDVILGTDVETKVDTVQTRTGDVLRIGSNQDGQIPQLGQFAQHAMAPFNDSLMMAARNFCSDTKLSLNNLGISSTAAPVSPDALEIIGDDLRDDILAWQKDLGEQLKHFTVTLYMYEHGLKEISPELQAKIDAIEAAWLPVFRPDVSKFGDGLNKMAAMAPDIVLQRSIWRRLGLTSKEIDQVVSSVAIRQEEY